MKIIGILARTENGLIGCDNSIPWSIKEDLLSFKEQTLWNTVVMGRRTWESIGKKALKDRLNIVVSSIYEQCTWSVANLSIPVTANTLKGAIEIHERINSNKDVYIIGGKSLFEKAIKELNFDEWYITNIPITINTDNGIYFKYDPTSDGFRLHDTAFIPVHNNIVNQIQIQHFIKE